MICAGQDPDFNFLACSRFKPKFDNVYAMVGCPDVAKDYDQKAEDKLVEQLKMPK